MISSPDSAAAGRLTYQRLGPGCRLEMVGEYVSAEHILAFVGQSPFHGLQPEQFVEIL